MKSLIKGLTLAALLGCTPLLYAQEDGDIATEGAPYRLHAVTLDSSYEELSAADDAAGLRELALELYAQGTASRRYGIGLLYVAASLQDAPAIRKLAELYRTGKDVPKDAASAAYLTALPENPSQMSDCALYEVFSYCLGQGGEPSTVRERGVDFAEGRKGVKVNEKKAIILYTAAADMGDAKAARWMGWRYLQGRGVKKDRQLSKLFFLRAAIQGDPGAREALRQHFNTTVEPSM